MPQFSPLSLSRLSTCHPDLQNLFLEVIKYFDCTILVGHRGEEDQNKAFAEKKTKLKFPHSKHNSMPSMAVDVAPFPIPKWSSLNDFVYFGGYVHAMADKLFDEKKMSRKLRYGGDWNRSDRVSDDSFQDLVHFELEGELE
jgi:peptidoglycan LD-endopeptidase CwlK